MFQNCEITLVLRRGLAEIPLNFGWCDRAIEVDKSERGHKKTALQELRGQDWDLLFSPHRSWTSRWWSHQVQASEKVGFHSWPYTQTVTDHRDWPEALRILSLLSPFDSRFHFSNEAHPLAKDWKIPDWALSSGSAPAKKAPHKTLAVFPGSQWAGKCWPLEHFSNLIGRAIQAGWQVGLFGGSEEKKFESRLLMDHPRVVSEIGKLSLLQTTRALENFNVVLANDSAGQHLGALARCHVISLFGPTVPAFGFRPWTNRWTLLEEDLPCRPCNPHGPRACPLGHHHCLQKLSPQKVLSVLTELAQVNE